MRFPVIEHISQFDEILKTKEEIKLKKEIVDGEEVSIISYMVELPTTFDSMLSRECRGITFDKNGRVISRPFHKFGNINQYAWTQAKDIEWKNVSLISNKWDGSLALPVTINNKVFWKTKKTFHSTQVEQISELAPEIGITLNPAHTHMFEYISPENRVVIAYEVSKLWYLMERDNITGEYFADQFKSQVPVMNEIKRRGINDLYAFMDYVRGLEGIEGYVLWDGNDFYKLKTQWYLDRHHALDTISVRDLIDLILNEKIDDIMATLNTYGFKANPEVEEYIKLVNGKVLQMFTNIHILYRSVMSMFDDRKTIAIYLNKEYPREAPAVFCLYNEKDPISVIKRIIGNELKQEYKNKMIFMGEK